MRIIGEKINTSRTVIGQAVENRDREVIVNAAKQQAAAGADFIDVNAGTFVDSEVESLCWLVETVQQTVDLPLCLDSPNPQALSEAIKRHRGKPMVNSISLEKDRYDAILPIVTAHACHIVALCMKETAMPVTADERVKAGAQLIEKLVAAGVALSDIYVDPLVQPVSVDVRMGSAVLDAIERVMTEFPGVHTVTGLSNVSFGLPVRRLINSGFLLLCMAKGLSAAILDPTDRQLMASLLTAEMLLGRDAFCENYISAYQEGRLSQGPST